MWANGALTESHYFLVIRWPCYPCIENNRHAQFILLFFRLNCSRATIAYSLYTTSKNQFFRFSGRERHVLKRRQILHKVRITDCNWRSILPVLWEPCWRRHTTPIASRRADALERIQVCQERWRQIRADCRWLDCSVAWNHFASFKWPLYRRFRILRVFSIWNGGNADHSRRSSLGSISLQVSADRLSHRGSLPLDHWSCRDNPDCFLRACNTHSNRRRNNSIWCLLYEEQSSKPEHFLAFPSVAVLSEHCVNKDYYVRVARNSLLSKSIVSRNQFPNRDPIQ